MMKDTVTMTQEELKTIIREAYKEGAHQLKIELGLDDEYAIVDIKDLRSLMKAIQQARKIVFNTVVQAVTVGIISLILAGVYLKVL